jgi:hypothetical protein
MQIQLLGPVRLVNDDKTSGRAQGGPAWDELQECTTGDRGHPVPTAQAHRWRSTSSVYLPVFWDALQFVCASVFKVEA